MTKVKLCGFTREEDVDYANELGVDFVGFVRHRQSARYVTLSRAKELMARLSAPTPVMVYRWLSRRDQAGDAWQQAESFGSWLSRGSPARFIVVRAGAGAPIETVPAQVRSLRESPVQFEENVRAVLIDAFVPGAGGGTGKRVDMDWAAEYVRVCEFPVILAGGLSPDNVAEAVLKVRPYAVDVSTGIESAPGIKDQGKMKAFVEAVRSVGEPIS